MTHQCIVHALKGSLPDSLIHPLLLPHLPIHLPICSFTLSQDPIRYSQITENTMLGVTRYSAFILWHGSSSHPGDNHTRVCMGGAATRTMGLESEEE